MTTEAKRLRSARRTALAAHRAWNAAMDNLEHYYATTLKALMTQAKDLNVALDAAGIAQRDAERVMDAARRLDRSAARRAA
jgi:endonuclease III